MRLTGLLFLLFFSIGLPAQKFMQIEKYGSLKVKKYYIGDNLTYQLKGDKTWYAGRIQDLLVDDELIVFANRFIKMDDIRNIRTRREWTQKVGTQLYWFSASWLFFSGTAALVNIWTLRWDTAIIAGSAIIVGWVLKKFFKYKKYKIGKRRRLRMLDLNMPWPVQNFGP